MLIPIDAHVYDIWANGGVDPWPDNQPALASVAASFLCYGARGCGKTFLAAKFFEISEKPHSKFSATEILSASEAALTKQFAKARRVSNAAILLEDADAVFEGLRATPSKRQNLLDELKSSPSTFFATATHPERLKPDELDAFGYVLPVFYGDALFREVVLVSHAERLPLDPFVRLDEIASQTEWWSAQELVAMISAVSGGTRRIVTNDDILRQIALFGSNIIPEHRARRAQELFKFTADHCTSKYIREDVKYRFGPEFVVPSDKVPEILHVNIETLNVIERQFNAPVGVYVESGGRAEHITVNQKWADAAKGIDLHGLNTELQRLRSEIERRRSVSTAIDDKDLNALSAAEAEAAKGNGAKALEYLSKAGKWLIDVAKEMSVKIAADALTRALGIGPPP